MKRLFIKDPLIMLPLLLPAIIAVICRPRSAFAFSPADYRLTDAAGIATISIMLLLAAVIGWFVSKHFLMRRIKFLSDATAEMGRGNLGVRVPVGKGKDELACLSHGFNLMAESLESHLAERLRTEKELSETNELLNRLIQGSPLAKVVYDRDNRVKIWNPAAERVFGWAAHEVMGLPPPFLFTGKPSESEVEEKSARGTGAEMSCLRKDGTSIDVVLWAGRVRDAGGRVIGRLEIYEDITERKQAEFKLQRATRALRALSASNEAVVRASDEQAFLAEICRILVEIGGYGMAWVALVDPADETKIQPVAFAGGEELYRKRTAFAQSEKQEGECPVLVALKTVKPCVVGNIATDPLLANLCEDMLKEGYGSAMALPFSLDGKAAGAMEIFAKETSAFDEDEVGLLNELAGDVAHCLGALRTRNEKMKAEQALAEQLERLRLIAENIREILYLSDVEVNEVQYISPSYETVWGRSREDLYKDPWDWLNGLLPSDRERVKKSYLEHVWDGPFDEEYRILRPDGSIRWIHDIGLPIRDEKGEIYRIVGVAEDITDHKLTEESLRHYSEEILSLYNASNALNKSLTLVNLQEVYENICKIAFVIFKFRMVWITLVDEKKREVKTLTYCGHEEGFVSEARFSWDEALQELCPMELAVREKAARNVNDIENDPCCIPWREMAISRGYRSVLAAPVLVREDGKSVMMALFSDELYFFSTERIGLIQAFANQAGVVLQNIELVETLEERVRLRTSQLEMARVEAEAASRAKSEFLANMSHELRTPMNSIIGFTEVIRDGMAGPVSDEQREFLKDVHDSAVHLLGLINDVLDLSRIEAGTLELEMGGFPLRVLLQEVMGMMKEKAAKQGVELSLDAPDDIGELVADEKKIRQALVNLLGNAIKFTLEGGNAGIAASRLEKEIQVTVWDTGIGIAEKDMEKLFQPFQQIETTLARKFEGTGLGLFLTKSLVDMHGGRIWAESEVGKGSRFTFSIPTEHSK